MVQNLLPRHDYKNIVFSVFESLRAHLSSKFRKSVNNQKKIEIDHACKVTDQQKSDRKLEFFYLYDCGQKFFSV
jgi:hypothetical protein